MRPLHVLLLLVLLAGLLVAGLLFVGRGDGGTAKGSSTSASTPGSAGSGPDGAKDGPDAAVALDGTGAGVESNRAISTVAPGAVQVANAAPGKKPASTLSLTGRIVGSLGKPVEGATVFAAERNDFATAPLDEIDPERQTWFHRAQATTDHDGRFRIQPESKSKVGLAVRAPGFAPLDRDFTLTTPERDLGDLALDASVVLSGRVVATNGRPIEHAKISRLTSKDTSLSIFGGPQGVVVAETDAQGSFRIDQLAAGPWHVLVAEPDHPDLVEEGETDRPGAVVSDLLFTLADGAEIRGRIVGAPAGAASKLFVRAVPNNGEQGITFDNPPAFPTGPRQTRCAPDGTFALRGLRTPESYHLVAREGTRDPFGSVRSTAVNAQAGDMDVQLVYQPDTAIVFQAVDAKTSLPVSSLDVQAGRSFTLPLLDEAGRPIRRFPEGKVRYGGIPPAARPASVGARTGADMSPAPLKLRVEAAGYQVLERSDLVVLEGQDNDLGIVRLEPAPLVTVLVLDAGTGAPVADAAVSLREEKTETKGVHARVAFSGEDDADDGDVFAAGTAQRARTGADGRASVTSLPGKTARLRVRHAGHAEFRSEPIALPAKENLEQTVRLSAGGTVTVFVADPRGNAVAGADVDHEGPEQGQATDTILSNAENKTDAEGKVVFEHLPVGSHRFRLRQGSNGGVFNMGGGQAVMRRVVRGGASQEEGWTSVEVAERAEATVRLVAPEKGTLTGRISEGGKALANATVRVAPRGASSNRMPFMDDGRSAHTDGTGDYQLDGIDEGEYTVTVEHATRAMGFDADTRIRAGENRLDLDLTVAIVEGTVTGEDGKPVVGVRMRAERAAAGGRRAMGIAVMVTSDGGDEPSVVVGSPGGSDPSATTDENGRYSLRGVAADVDLVVQGDAKDSQPARSDKFQVKPDELRKGVDLKLERGGVIQVTVQRAGKPAGGFLARAVLVDGDPMPKVQMVGPSGNAKLSGLKPGKWRVNVDPLQGIGGDANGAEIREQEVDVKVGETAKVTFDAP